MTRGGRSMQAKVKVWFTIAGEITPLVYGHFIEHLGRCIYGGVFDPTCSKADSNGFRLDVAEAARNIKCPLLRWPGGNFASAYHWMDGIGPVKARPQHINYVWGGLESNRFGTDEFIEYCRLVGAEPYITLNLGTGTLEEALHWLEYCNLSTPTKYATLRRKYGHAEPYNVKYWGIGNEVYGEWQVGHCSAEEYAEKCRQYAQFMKNVDPTIKLVAVGADDPDWDLVVLKRAGKLIDYISIHQYHGSEDYYETVAAAYYVEKRLQLLESLIRHAKLEHVKIALDEWNVWYQVDPSKEAEESGVVLLEETYALKDALFAAGVFLVLHRMSDIVGMANLAQMVNALGMIKTRRDAMVLTPTYYVFDLFVNHTGRVRLGLEIVSDTYSIKAKSFIRGLIRFSLDRVPYLDGSATYDSQRHMVCLALVNFHKDEACEVEIDLGDLQVAEEGQALELTAADPYAANDFTTPTAVVPQIKRIAINKKIFVAHLPPHSLTVFEFPVNKPLNREKMQRCPEVT